jgi:hypothetical protein
MCNGKYDALDNYDVEYQEAMEDLQYEIDKNGLECADNYRAYRVSDAKGKAEFLSQKRSGCCGFFGSHTMINGNKWIIGCNYGH